MELILDKDICFEDTMGIWIGYNVRIIKDETGFYRVHLSQPYDKYLINGYGRFYIETICSYINKFHLRFVPNRKIYWSEDIRKHCSKPRVTKSKLEFYESWNGDLSYTRWIEEYTDRSFFKYYKKRIQRTYWYIEEIIIQKLKRLKIRFHS